MTILHVNRSVDITEAPPMEEWPVKCRTCLWTGAYGQVHVNGCGHDQYDVTAMPGYGPAEADA